MKVAIFTLLAATTLHTSAQAGTSQTGGGGVDLHTVCYEAQEVESPHYEASLVTNGFRMDLVWYSPTRAAVLVEKRGRTLFDTDNAKIVLPKVRQEGFMGGIHKGKNLQLDFAFLPYYVETESGAEYVGGQLSLHKKDYFVLCDKGVEEFFLPAEYEHEILK